MAGQGPFWAQVIDQVLKRHILMRISAQRRLPRPGDQRGETVPGPHRGAQHQGIDEKPDQAAHRLIRAARDRRADRDVIPRP